MRAARRSTVSMKLVCSIAMTKEYTSPIHRSQSSGTSQPAGVTAEGRRCVERAQPPEGAYTGTFEAHIAFNDFGDTA